MPGGVGKPELQPALREVPRGRRQLLELRAHLITTWAGRIVTGPTHVEGHRRPGGLAERPHVGGAHADEPLETTPAPLGPSLERHHAAPWRARLLPPPGPCYHRPHHGIPIRAARPTHQAWRRVSFLAIFATAGPSQAGRERARELPPSSIPALPGARPGRRHQSVYRGP